MKAFVTGGTGFIGSQLVKQLLDKGYEIVALVHNTNHAKHLNKNRIVIAKGDITIRETMVEAMRGCDVVFHLAGWYKIGSRDQQLAQTTNVDGTRNVLELACELKIPRIIHTSSLSVFGDTHGKYATENYLGMENRNFLTEYDRTKWEAHYLVAHPMVAQGAPVTIVSPGVVYGPGDKSLIGQLIYWYLKGLLIAFPGPETMQSFTHVEDAADGLIRSFENGNPGVHYLLTGQSYPLWQIVELWSALVQRPPPRFYVPANWIKCLEPLARVLPKFLPLPELLSADGIRLLGATYIGNSEISRQELGWQPRSLEIGFKETLDWFSNTYTL